MPSSRLHRDGRLSFGIASISGSSQNKETSWASPRSSNEPYFGAPEDQARRSNPYIDRRKYDQLPAMREAEVRQQYEEHPYRTKVFEQRRNERKMADPGDQGDHQETGPSTISGQARMPSSNSCNHAENMNTGEQEEAKPPKSTTISPATVNFSQTRHIYNYFQNSAHPQTVRFGPEGKEKSSSPDPNVAEGTFQTKSERALIEWLNYFTFNNTNTSRRQTRPFSSDPAQPLMTGANGNIYPRTQNSNAAKDQDQDQSGSTQPIFDAAWRSAKIGADEDERHAVKMKKANDKCKGKASEKPVGEASKKKSLGKKTKTLDARNSHAISGKKRADEKNSKSQKTMSKRFLKWSQT